MKFFMLQRIKTELSLRVLDLQSSLFFHRILQLFTYTVIYKSLPLHPGKGPQTFRNSHVPKATFTLSVTLKLRVGNVLVLTAVAFLFFTLDRSFWFRYIDKILNLWCTKQEARGSIS